MSENTVTLENHPSTLTVNRPEQRDGQRTLVEHTVELDPKYLHAFNMCTDTSLATLRLRADLIGLAPHGDKAAIVARAHEYLTVAESALALVGAWKETGEGPTVEAGKRGRPAGSVNKAPEAHYVIFDGTGPVTANKAQFDAYCAAVTAGQTPKQAVKAAMAN